MGHTNFELCKISNKKLAWATNKKKEVVIWSCATFDGR